jgi:hypothetical protein
VVNADMLCNIWSEGERLVDLSLKAEKGEKEKTENQRTLTEILKPSFNPKDLQRSFFSTVTERAANLKADGSDHGSESNQSSSDSNGSLTLLLTVESQSTGNGNTKINQKLTAGSLRVADSNTDSDSSYHKRLALIRELQSLSDGHLWFEDKKGKSTLKLNAHKSLTRFGLGSDKAALKGRHKGLQQVGGFLRTKMASVLGGGGEREGIRKKESERRGTKKYFLKVELAYDNTN